MDENKYISIIERYLPRNAARQIHGNLIVCELPVRDIEALCECFYDRHQLPLMTITCFDEREETGSFRIMYVFGIPGENLFLAPSILVREDFPSLTSWIHEASIYERKIKTFFGLRPVGHPNPRPLILHENWPAGGFPLRKDFDWNTRPPEADGYFQFRELGGEGIYEIPVGPVHAGIIEPGHFRFSVAGEEILLLEPRLGYSHKGSEKLFEVLPIEDKLKLAERISGDSSFSHALAFCLALESLGGVATTDRDDLLRVIFCELERLANHLGDIGAIMMDTGFNFGGASGSRLRESVMQMNEKLTGSRFLRGVVNPGGISRNVRNNVTPEVVEATVNELAALEKDFAEVMAVAEGSNTLMNRLKNAGVLPLSIAMDHGVRGIPAKAVGLARDARADYPYAAYRRLELGVAVEDSGDVYARFEVRVKEVYSTFSLLQQALEELAQTQVIAGGTENKNREEEQIILRENAFAIGVVEGWRGDIVYVAATDSRGQISRVDVRDPSFLNWTALGYAGQENMVPDFPLINKSFNLSYSGNDL